MLQPFGMRAVCWDDPQRAEADVQHAMAVASSRVDLARLPLLTAGYSQGAAMAIALAATRRLPGVVGFIAVTPAAGWALQLLEPGELHAKESVAISSRARWILGAMTASGWCSSSVRTARRCGLTWSTVWITSIQRTSMIGCRRR